MIRSSDAAIARGSKAPNQPSDGLASTTVDGKKLTGYAPYFFIVKTLQGGESTLRDVKQITVKTSADCFSPGKIRGTKGTRTRDLLRDSQAF
jgi:hypothetical protein